MRVFWKFVRFVFLFAVMAGIGGASGAILAGYIHYTSILPELDAAVNYRPAIISKVFDRNGQLLGEFAAERRIIVPLSEIPEVMKQAIIAVEDEHFYSHHGLDTVGIARAAMKNALAGEIIQGGSTITQQLAKTLFFSRERTLQRKIKEALIAMQLERVLPKNRILELYLNQVYFGAGAYGLEAASRRYFGKSSSELNLEEASVLAGLPKAPSKFSPLRNPDLARARRDVVLKCMLDNQFITEEEYDRVITAPIALSEQGWANIEAPYFVEVVRRQLEKEFGYDTLYTEGLQVFTPLNLEFQRAAEKAVRLGLHDVEHRRPWRGPVPGLQVAEALPETGDPVGAEITMVGTDRLTLRCAGQDVELLFKDIWIKNADLRKLEPGDHVLIMVDEFEDREDAPPRIAACHITQDPTVEGALLSIDPATGEVLAWVGGYDFSRSQFDRVSQAFRQPGSAFKPFIYAAALDSRFTSADVIYDTPIVIEKTWEEGEEEEIESDSENPEPEEIEYWKPHNYSEEFFGATTLRTGLSKSRNIISIHLLREVGIQNVIRLARRAGIRSPLTESLSLALGASELSLLELTSSYSTFANQGVAASPMMIHRILNRDGKTLREYYPVLRRAIRPETAYLITYLLQGVIQHGTGVRARSLGYPMGGKTGTTNAYYDTWFMGFTPELVTGVWVGVDQNEEISKRATGASTALPIWMDYMGQVLTNYQPIPFPEPDGIVFEDVCRDSGLLVTKSCPDLIHEAFREGTEPIQYCTVHQETIRRSQSAVSFDWDSADVFDSGESSGEDQDSESPSNSEPTPSGDSPTPESGEAPSGSPTGPTSGGE